MYICNCHGITEREIRGAVELGCATLHDLRRDLGVSGNCGKCAPDAARVLERCTRSCAGCPAEAAGGHD